ncbi:VOC family protein [Streptomyces eurythermus]|uniref:VOC family protein n=1 Tax=Streptomyces eurythermus TaxID=42237 RepID=UPI003673FB8D
MSRRTPDGTVLRRRLTGTDAGAVPDPVPFLIDWGDSRHPAASGLPVTPLPAVSASVPDPEAVRTRPAAPGTSLDLTEGPTALSFTVDTPNGPVVFG